MNILIVHMIICDGYDNLHIKYGDFLLLYIYKLRLEIYNDPELSEV